MTILSSHEFCSQFNYLLMCRIAFCRAAHATSCRTTFAAAAAVRDGSSCAVRNNFRQNRASPDPTPASAVTLALPRPALWIRPMPQFFVVLSSLSSSLGGEEGTINVASLSSTPPPLRVVVMVVFWRCPRPRRRSRRGRR